MRVKYYLYFYQMYQSYGEVFTDTEVFTSLRVARTRFKTYMKDYIGDSDDIELRLAKNINYKYHTILLFSNEEDSELLEDNYTDIKYNHLGIKIKEINDKHNKSK